MPINDVELRDRFINEFRDYIKLICGGHAYAFMPTSLNHIFWIENFLNEWKMPDIRFENEFLENYKSSILVELDYLYGLLSDPTIIRIHGEDHVFPIKDETRKSFKKFERDEFNIRKTIVSDYQKFCCVVLNRPDGIQVSITALCQILVNSITNAIISRENDPSRLKENTTERQFCDDIRDIVAEGIKDTGMCIHREKPAGFAKKSIGETDLFVDSYMGGEKVNIAVGEVKEWGSFKRQVQQLFGYMDRHTLIGFTIVLNKNHALEKIQNEMVEILVELGGGIVQNQNIIISEHVQTESQKPIRIYHFIANAYCEARRQMAIDARK
jgi:hypothetical protein